LGVLLPLRFAVSFIWFCQCRWGNVGTDSRRFCVSLGFFCGKCWSPFFPLFPVFFLMFRGPSSVMRAAGGEPLFVPNSFPRVECFIRGAPFFAFFFSGQGFFFPFQLSGSRSFPSGLSSLPLARKTAGFSLLSAPLLFVFLSLLLFCFSGFF